MFGRTIKWLGTPFVGKGLRSEDGVVPVLVAAGLAAAGYASLEVVKKGMDDSEKAEQRAVKQYYLQLANETAIEQVSQLIGNFVILVDGGTKKFKKGAAIAGLNQTGGVIPTNATTRSWSLNSQGVMTISTCLRPKLTNADLDVAFANNDNNSWYNNTNNCDTNAQVQTTVSVNELLAEGSVKWDDGSTDDLHKYAMVTATTRLTNPDASSQGIDLTKRARLQLADPAKVCLAGFATEACNVDQCKFMEPARDAAGSVRYYSNGKYHVRPNALYDERVRLTIDSAIHNIVKADAADPDPVALKNWLDAAYAPGRRHPFSQWQGIEGTVTKTPLIEIAPDGAVYLNPTLDVADPASPIEISKKGAKKKAHLKFDGFLYKTDYSSSGSLAIAWPADKSYDDIAWALKRGCDRTIGTTAPDFCTRINFTYELNNYNYPRIRHCDYFGPNNYSESGLYPWDKVSSHQSISDWASVSSGNPGRRKISDNRTAYVDNYPHHDFGTGGQIHVLTKHNFSNIKVGDVREEEIRADKSEEEVTETVTKEDGTTEEVKKTVEKTDYFRRTIDSKFSVSCQYQNVTNLSYDHDLTVCFYLVYFNVKNRLTCQPSVSGYQCRNSNGCFVKGTPILMADGQYKNIDEIKSGEYVFNPASGTPIRVGQVVVGDQKSDMYKLTFGGKTITATHNHPFMTGFGIKRAEELTTNDVLIDKDYHTVRLEAVEKVAKEEGGLVWNLLLTPDPGEASENLVQDHLFVANGMVSGDFFIQNDGAKKQKVKDFEEFGNFMLSRQVSPQKFSH